jgi:hypothetical protein
MHPQFLTTAAPIRGFPLAAAKPAADRAGTGAGPVIGGSWVNRTVDASHRNRKWM